MALAACAFLTALAGACGAGYTGAAPTSAPAARGNQAASAATVWLCRPGQADDPCTGSLRATVVAADGTRTAKDAPADSGAVFDCFYVYPTVSTQPSDNATLQVQPSEISVAALQASRFSQDCRVWAPMYRQRTLASLLKGLGADPRADDVAYTSLLAGWREYLDQDNHGRPIIFIGDSQGAAMLIRLLAGQVDHTPSLLARTVIAILAGGNVTVPVGATVGATFGYLPLCSATARAGCVIAYSSFPSQPPPDALFGRPGQGVSLQSGQTATSGVQVACVNPAAPGGGTTDLDPYFPGNTFPAGQPPITTPWVTYPALYSAACMSSGGASWLQVNTLTTGVRPVVTETLGPAWGFHAEDINLALGNLVSDVSAAEAAYTDRHP